MICGVSFRIVSVAVVYGAMATASGQVPATAPTSDAASASPASVSTPSGVVQPAIGALKQMLGVVRVDKWKMPKGVRDVTAGNVNSIGKDVDSTLPMLLATADASPNSVAGLLPVSRNMAALYDVLLRVTVVAETSAPRDQADALEQAMASLEGTRHTFDDQVQGAAVAREQRVIDLQKALNARPPLVVAPAPPPPATAVTHPKKKKRPVAKTPPVPAKAAGTP